MGLFSKGKNKLKRLYRQNVSSQPNSLNLNQASSSSLTPNTPSRTSTSLPKGENVAQKNIEATTCTNNTSERIVAASHVDTTQASTSTKTRSEHARSEAETVKQDDDSGRVKSPKDYWNIAVQRLRDEEKVILKDLLRSKPDPFAENDVNPTAADESAADDLESLTPLLLASLASDKVKRLDDKAWKFRFRGRDIILRDSASKIVLWLGKFKEIGDVAVSYDPVHAALPWAAIRFLLQAVTSHQDLAGHMLIGVEKASYLLARCQMYRKLYLNNEREASLESASQLEETLVLLYSEILSLLAHLVTLTNRSSAQRSLHAMFNPSGLSEWITKLENVESRIEADASNCERECRSLSDDTWRERYDAMQKLLNQHLVLSEEEKKRFLERCEEDERSAILQWISSVPYEADHYNARLGRTEGTGEWLLAEQVYREWRTASASLCLWLHGIPGAGKTKLSTKVVDDLMASDGGQSEQEPVAYFYCDRNRQDHQDPLSVLRSFIRQLAASQSDMTIIKCVRDKYMQAKLKGFSSVLNQDDCSILLLQLVKIFPRTIFVLDGLDECDKGTRYKLMDILEDVIVKAEHPVKIFIASREDEDLAHKYSGGDHLKVSASRNQGDIERFVWERMQESRYCRTQMRDTVRTQVFRTFREKSNGMFQWAALHIQELLDFERDRDVLKYLDELPVGLKSAYDQIYARITAQGGSRKDVAIAAIKWVICANRPLAPGELVIAACQDPAEDFNDDIDITPMYLLDACHNLIEVYHARQQREGCLSAGEAELVKRTIEGGPTQLRTRTKFKNPSEGFIGEYWPLSESFRFIEQIGRWIYSVSETDIIQGVLSSKIHFRWRNRHFRHRHNISQLARQAPQMWLIYAIAEWSNHVRRVILPSTAMDSQKDHVGDLTIRFLGHPVQGSPWYRSWAVLFDLLGSYTRNSREEAALLGFQRFYPALWCAATGFEPPLARWLEQGVLDANFSSDGNQIRRPSGSEEPDEISTEVGLRFSLLYAAVSGMQDGVAQLLISHGATDAVTNNRGVILELAIRLKQNATVNLLLHNQVDSSRAERRRVPLHLAAYSGSLEMVQLLVEGGADADDLTCHPPWNLTAFEMACLNPLTDANAKFLVNRVSDIDVRHPRALRLAAMSDKTELVLRLVALGASVEGPPAPSHERQSGPSDLDTPILFVIRHHAKRYFSLKAPDKLGLRALLECGADPNVVGTDGLTPLQIAAMAMDHKMMIILIWYGADITVKFDNGGTVFQLVCRNGYLPLARFLIKRGVDVSEVSGPLRTPLYAAYLGVVWRTRKRSRKWIDIQEWRTRRARGLATKTAYIDRRKLKRGAESTMVNLSDSSSPEPSKWNVDVSRDAFGESSDASLDQRISDNLEDPEYSEDSDNPQESADPEESRNLQESNNPQKPNDTHESTSPPELDGIDDSNHSGSDDAGSDYSEESDEPDSGYPEDSDDSDDSVDSRVTSDVGPWTVPTHNNLPFTWKLSPHLLLETGHSPNSLPQDSEPSAMIRLLLENGATFRKEEYEGLDESNQDEVALMDILVQRMTALLQDPVCKPGGLRARLQRRLPPEPWETPERVFWADGDVLMVRYYQAAASRD